MVCLGVYKNMFFKTWLMDLIGTWSCLVIIFLMFIGFCEGNILRSLCVLFYLEVWFVWDLYMKESVSSHYKPSYNSRFLICHIKFYVVQRYSNFYLFRQCRRQSWCLQEVLASPLSKLCMLVCQDR